MKELLEYISTWSVLKWVILVLIAGFIGQFGRMMAEALITRVRLRRIKQHPLPEDTKRADTPAVPPADISPEALPSKPATAAEISGKKALKAMAKARKKEMKKN